jgi:hypothetical protein
MATGPAQVQKFLAGVDYPCGKQDLVDHAIDNGASQDVVNMLESMPDGSYRSSADVSRAIGEVE